VARIALSNSGYPKLKSWPKTDYPEVLNGIPQFPQENIKIVPSNMPQSHPSTTISMHHSV
jgi:hypothetical protein